MTFFEIFSLSFSAVYLIFFLFILIGYEKGNKSIVTRNAEENYASIIIPFRNEEKNLPSLLSSLLKLKTNSGEIIFVDDHSEDMSWKLVSDFFHPKLYVQCICLDNDVFGKKQAIVNGIQNARYEIILTTDADCIIPENWIEEHLKSRNSESELLSGGVDLIHDGGIWNHFQDSENMVIQIISSGFANWNLPISVNAANLSYSKKEFLKRNPYSENFQEASGDDIFLLHAMKRKKNPVTSLQQSEIMVQTKTTSFFDYLQQHIRWMRKSSSFSDLITVVVGFLIFFSAIHFLILAVYQPLSGQWSNVFLFSAAVKSGVDFLLLFLIVRRRKKWHNLLFFIPSFLMNVFMTAFIPLIGWFIPLKWKNRKI